MKRNHVLKFLLLFYCTVIRIPFAQMPVLLLAVLTVAVSLVRTAANSPAKRNEVILYSGVYLTFSLGLTVWRDRMYMTYPVVFILCRPI